MGTIKKDLRRNGDTLRRLLMLEPRGHSGMHGVLFTEPVSAGSHAGLLSMHAAGFPLISGEDAIAAATLALENGIIQGPFHELAIDTPAGLLRLRPRFAPDATGPPRVTSIALTGVPSFVYSAGVSVEAGGRSLRADVAFGGEFYAIVDSEAAGIPINMVNGPLLVRMGLEIARAIDASRNVEHPVDARLKGIHGTIFTGPPATAADLRSATVLEGGVSGAHLA